MNRYTNIFVKTVTIVFVTVFFYACQDNYADIKRMQKASLAPAGIAENINLKHTDSGKLRAHLISAKMLDFSNKEFAYNSFPEGLVVYLYENGNKTTVKADQAVVYNKTQLIDLRGNVQVLTHDGKKLLADQLYYDQKTEWLFTNQSYKYESEDGGYNIGKGGFDANADFTIFSSFDNDGEQYINK